MHGAIRFTPSVLSVVLVLLVLVVLSGCTKPAPQPAVQNQVDTTAHSAMQDYWTCTMHPFIHADQPGPCPICGMPLVKKSVVAATEGDIGNAAEAVHFSPTERVLANIQTVTVERLALPGRIVAVGVVDVAESSRSKISARFRGRIDQLHANVVGMRVYKGDPLLEMYSPDVVAAAGEYLVAFHGAGTDASFGDRQMLSAARAKLQMHFGLRDGQITAIEQSGKPDMLVTVFSPISGIVLRKDIVEGAYVNEGAAMLEIADLSSVWVLLDVYERDLPRVAIGQTVRISTDDQSLTDVASTITFIDPVMNPATRTVRVRASFANPNMKLRPQMFVHGNIATHGALAIVIPTSSVVNTGTRAVVWVEREPGTFEPRDVQLGARSGEFVEVVHGLTAGERIAASGAFLIDSESQLAHPSASVNKERQ